MRRGQTADLSKHNGKVTINMDFWINRGVRWIQLAPEMVQKQELLNILTSLIIPWKWRHFLTRLATVFISRMTLLHEVKLLNTDRVMVTSFWDIAPCSLIDVHRRFRSTCCLHHQDNETSVYFHDTTRRFFPECCHLPTRYSENLRSHTEDVFYAHYYLVSIFKLALIHSYQQTAPPHPHP
jgi:hypothetical protein